MKRIIYRVYICVIFLPLFVVLTILAAVVAGVGCLWGSDAIFSYYPGMIWSRLTLALLLTPVEIQGQENIPADSPCVICANHQSAIDIFLLYGYIGVPFKWVLRASLRKIPFVGWACEKSGFIFADNSSPEAARKVVDDAKKALERGFYIMIFPEGTRSQTGKLGRFKKGAFRIVLDTHTPILPVSVNGAYEVLPKTGQRFPEWHRLRLVIHPPIQVANYGTDIRGMISLAQDTHQAVQAGLEPQYLC